MTGGTPAAGATRACATGIAMARAAGAVAADRPQAAGVSYKGIRPRKENTV